MDGGDRRADVVIIGAGVVGASIARAAAIRGLDAVLVDPAPGGGSSVGNAGLVVPSYCMPMSTPSNLLAGLQALGDPAAPVGLAWPMSVTTVTWLARFALACRQGRAKRAAVELHRLAARSRSLYDQFARDGLDVGLRATGWLWAYRSQAALRAARTVARQLSEVGSHCQVVGASRAHELEPALGEEIAGGLWFPDEATLDPARATAALLADARARGVPLCRQRVVDACVDGHVVTGVRTPGGTVRGRWFVIAAGARSRDVAAKFGTRLAVEPGYGWSLTLPDDKGIVRRALMAAEDHVVISPLAGAVRLTGGMQFGGRPDDRPPARLSTLLRSAAERMLPGLRALPEGTTWRGARPMTPSGLPFTGRVGRHANLLAATGHGTLGMTLAPVTGEVVAGYLGR
jgi:D-amino-acid dehydrogenase